MWLYQIALRNYGLWADGLFGDDDDVVVDDDHPSVVVELTEYRIYSAYYNTNYKFIKLYIVLQY